MTNINLESFRDEVTKLAASEKDADMREMLTHAKDVLTAPIPGTKPWLLGHGDAARAAVKKTVGTPGVTKKLTGQGGYDVSHMAQKMGL